MESDIFTVIESALQQAGYKILDGDKDTVYISHPNSDHHYEIKVTECEES